MNLASFKLNSPESGVCVVLGLGLVGNSIANLFGQYLLEIERDNVDWKNSTECAEKIISSTKNNSGDERLELVWAAGHGGFSATADQMNIEVRFYTDVLKKLQHFYGENLKVNLISSAGGIYENSAHVTEPDAISAVRPYAEAKLAQEHLLSDLNIRHRIYRASSVYGLGGNRAGLISSLLQGAITGTEVRIFAQQNTMRDYIFNRDIARVIAQDIVSNAADGTFILASGRAVSINMLLNMVARISRRRVKAYYQSDASNENDISFAKNVIKRPLNSTSLEEGIALMHKQLALMATS